jgi:hypothetical protein
MPFRFTKKNPLMSLWLSAANRAAATGLGALRAASQRQKAASLREATKAATAFWTSSAKLATGRKKSRTKR